MSAKFHFVYLLNLKKSRELLSKSENKRLNFDNSISLSDDDYFNLTGVSIDQFDYIYSMIIGLRNSKYSVRTAIGVLLTKLRTGLSSSIHIKNNV